MVGGWWTGFGGLTFHVLGRGPPLLQSLPIVSPDMLSWCWWRAAVEVGPMAGLSRLVGRRKKLSRVIFGIVDNIDN